MKNISDREYKYQSVIKELVKRYVMRKQQRNLNAGVTEDDLNEIKQDISGLRFELLEIFKKNDFKVDVLKQTQIKRKRGKLNLEKAMNKNLFQEASPQKQEKIGSFKVSSECKVRFSTPPLDGVIHSSKQSVKSNKSNTDSTTTTTSNTPAMYKIALNIKKFTQSKFKKDQMLRESVTGNNKINNTNTDNDEKKLLKLERDNSKSSTDVEHDDEIISAETLPTKGVTTETILPENDSFVERITEV
jgi:hypothetical protein